MNNKPVILAAFANDQGRFLESLQQESDAISDALHAKKDGGYIDLEVQQGASIERLFTLIGRYGDDLAMLHYGGHANGSALDDTHGRQHRHHVAPARMLAQTRRWPRRGHLQQRQRQRQRQPQLLRPARAAAACAATRAGFAHAAPGTAARGP